MLNVAARLLYSEGNANMLKLPWWEKRLKKGDQIFWGTHIKAYGENAHFHWLAASQPGQAIGQGTVVTITAVHGDCRVQLDG